MTVIGFRCFTDGFSYVVLNGKQSEPKIVAYNRIVFPPTIVGDKNLRGLEGKFMSF